jgi:Spy/CpxP family protein refolding chaperone
MSLMRWLIVLAAVALVAPTSAQAQQPKDPPKSGAGKADDGKPDTPAVRGQLPPNWKALGLTDDQKSKVYSVHGKYRTRIADLEKQIKELRAEERKDLEKILTADQKARLKEIVAGKVPGASDKPPEK